MRFQLPSLLDPVSPHVLTTLREILNLALSERSGASVEYWNCTPDTQGLLEASNLKETNGSHTLASAFT
jgi:hypothetical protein